MNKKKKKRFDVGYKKIFIYVIIYFFSLNNIINDDIFIFLEVWPHLGRFNLIIWNVYSKLNQLKI